MSVLSVHGDAAVRSREVEVTIKVDVNQLVACLCGEGILDLAQRAVATSYEEFMPVYCSALTLAVHTWLIERGPALVEELTVEIVDGIEGIQPS